MSSRDKPAELSEIAVDRGAFRTLPGMLPLQPFPDERWTRKGMIKKLMMIPD